MARQQYLSSSRTYDYEIEFPYDGAISEGVEDAQMLPGDVTWGADVEWNESLEQYEILTHWDDHGGNSSQIGNGPREDEFDNDLMSYLGDQSISMTSPSETSAPA